MNMEESFGKNDSSTECKEINLKDNACQVTDKKDENCFPYIGNHENQVSEGGEADLQKHRKNCKKNQGHADFIPIESFSLNHLPEGHHDSDLYELIKAAAELTIKLSVTMTSPDRPDFWQNTKRPYFLSKLKGKKTLRTGTGSVKYVRKYTDEDKHWKYTTCPCDICKDSNTPSKVWWEIDVYTAAHVVVDDVEASHTTLRFFYDREDSPSVILKDKVNVYYVDIEEDKSMFTCVTCDENLGNKLKRKEEHYNDVWAKVYDKYEKHRDLHKLNFIVSHPHGCSKQVSVGHWKDIVNVGDDYRFMYKTCTCPGSSGASVHCVGYSGGWLIDYVHSGSSKTGLNYSGLGSVL